MDALWPGTFVEEANLSYTASTVRRALGDDRAEPRYIETVPTKGYRFVGEVRRRPATAQQAADAPHESRSVSPPKASPRRGRSRRVLTAAALLLVAAAGVLAGVWPGRFWRWPWSSAVQVSSIAVLPLEDLSGGPEYFADGLTEEIITEISRTAKLEKADDVLGDGGRSFIDLHEARLGRAGRVCARAPGRPVCGFAWARSGNLAEARRIFQGACSGMKREGSSEDHTSMCLQLAAALGDREPLLAWTERLARNHDWICAFFRAPEIGGLLDNEPRFEAVLRQVGLSP